MNYLFLEANSMEAFKNQSGFLSKLKKIFSKEVQFNFMIKLGGFLISFLSGYGAINIPLS